jgi:DNA-cytosine methyltransferase
MSQDKDRPIAIDLFCGAGGFSNGFENAGIDVRLGIDVDDDALKTFSHNHKGEAINQDIREGVPDEVLKNDYDIVFGSPPCKGFSDARGSRYVDDDRNGLVFEYIHWVEEMQPDIAVMENVTGMRTIGEEFMDGMRKEFMDSGYHQVKVKELNSANFGVPQKRKRVIVIATHKDNNYRPSFPPESKQSESPEGVQTLDNRTRTTVEEAFADLPDVTEDGVARPDYSKVDMSTVYSEYVRHLDEGDVLHNHKAKTISDNKEIAQNILSRLNPGEMYRSTRFGDRYRQIWDVLEDEFTEVENDSMRFIGRHRSKKDYRIKGKSVGHVDVEMIKEEIPHDGDNVEEALDGLVEDDWLRKDEVDDRVGYDLNTNSGVRPRYMRLQPDSQSNTILTTDFKPRDKAHPFEDRGLSLREGARIQSFPDSFEFKGSFQSVASQIGNAVPPIMAYRIGQHLIEKME